MKKKIVMLLVTVMMAVSMAACGRSGETSADSTQEVAAETKEEDEEEQPEVVEEKEVDTSDLPNWRGVKQYYGAVHLDEGGFGFDIWYPSLVPTTNGNWAYQMDPALILVTCTDYDENWNPMQVTSLEEAFESSKNKMVLSLDGSRTYEYQDFDFIVDTSELLTINDMDACYYTGRHTYTFEGEPQEIPFVAYSVDTKQTEKMYPFTIIVMDDSINHSTSMDPLPEGTIEAYAKKMVESIVLDDGKL